MQALVSRSEPAGGASTHFYLVGPSGVEALSSVFDALQDIPLKDDWVSAWDGLQQLALCVKAHIQDDKSASHLDEGRLLTVCAHVDDESLSY